MLLVVVLGVVAVAADKPPPPSGTLSIATTSIAVGIGVNWGTGTLTTGGKRYRFDLKGLEIGGIGVSKVQAKGQVYNLKKVADFAGNYVAATGDAAVGVGAGLLTMRNEHGVVVNIQSTQKGVKLTAGAEGILITLHGR
jgi:hypothetical protein